MSSVVSNVDRTPRYHLIIIIAVAVAVFCNGLVNGFVWDDKNLLLGQAVYRNFELWKILTSPANGLEYLPVRDMSYAIDYAIWGGNPFGFHLTNLLLYVLNLVALYFLTIEICRLLRQTDENTDGHRFTALAATLLFAVHPIHCESVSFITCRNVQLSGLFFFGSILLFLRYLRSAKGWEWGVSLLLFVLALFSKATSIILPVVLLLCLMFAPRRPRHLLAVIPFFLTAAAAYPIFRTIGYQAGIINDNLIRFGTFSFTSKVTAALQIPFFYLGKLLLPFGFSTEYTPHFASTMTAPKAIAALAFLVATAIVALALRKRRPEILFASGWFIIGLGPVLNLFPTTPVVADRYAYIASFGFCYLLATLLPSAERRKQGRVLCVVGILLLVWWGGASMARNRAWKSNMTLYADAVAKSPRALLSTINLGYAYLYQGDYEEAIKYFTKAKKLMPTLGYVDYARGRRYLDRNELPQAVTAFEAALGSNRNFVDALYFLGLTYEKMGETQKGVDCYKRVLQQSELEGIGGFREMTEQRLRNIWKLHAEELDALRARVQSQPADIRARGELALTLDRLGMFDEAKTQYLELERLGFRNWQLYYNLGNIYKKERLYREAAAAYEKSLQFNPGYFEAINNLGLVYRALHYHQKAIVLFRDAMSKNPAYAYNLAVTYFNIGDRANARSYFEAARNASPAMSDRISIYLKEME